MGIVVTVFMLLGLMMLSPWDKVSLGGQRDNPRTATTIGIGLLLLGLWNSLWHGLRYLDYFWGIAGLVSGVFMVAVAFMLLKQYAKPAIADHTLVTKANGFLQPMKAVWLVGLLVSFLLYSVTLIQLNLGMPTIG